MAGYRRRRAVARREAKELLRIDPKFTVSGWKRDLSGRKNRARLDALGDLLVQAGLSE